MENSKSSGAGANIQDPQFNNESENEGAFFGNQNTVLFDEIHKLF